ncbi:MAG TPA: hypothetical protein VLV88_09595 [Terriglobales bacterium]|nr:hypothetical protein [Terriglobales bacterium]
MAKAVPIREGKGKRWNCFAVHVVICTLFFAAFSFPSDSQELPDAPKPKLIASAGSKKLFLTLSAGVYAAGFLDMHEWIADRNHGHKEVDPLAKPFAQWPAPAYYAAGLGLDTGVNFLSYKMGKSRRWRKWRHLPQLIAISGNLYGYFSSCYRVAH